MWILGELPSADGWPAMLGVIANLGFAAVVGWYLLTKALPKIQDDFKSELGAQRKDFRESIDQQRRDYLESDKGRSAEHKESLKTVMDHCQAESIRRDAAMSVEIAGLGKVVDDNREVMEQVRDELREFRVAMAKMNISK